MKKRSSNTALADTASPARATTHFETAERTKPAVAKPKPVRSVRERGEAARGPGRRLSAEARRAQIIAVAEELFNTRPYAELGVPEVARALHITPGLVYHYFPTKEALLVAAVELRARELLAACLPDPTLPFLQQIEHGIRGYFDHVEAHSLAYRNLLRGPTAGEPAVLRICEDVRNAIVEHFLAAGGLAGAEFPATRLAVRAYVGFSEHAILQWLERRQIPRTITERMCIGMMLAAFRVGVSSDAASPFSARQLAHIEAAYSRHFGLHQPARSE